MTPTLCAMARHFGRRTLAGLLTLGLSPTLSVAQPAAAPLLTLMPGDEKRRKFRIDYWSGRASHTPRERP